MHYYNYAKSSRICCPTSGMLYTLDCNYRPINISADCNGSALSCLHPRAIFTSQRHCWLGVILLLYVFGRLFKIERHKKFKCKLIMCTTPLCMLHVYPWPIVLLPPSPFSYPFFLPLVLLPDVGSLVNQTAKHQYWLARHSLLNMQLRERSREVRTPSTRAHTHITSHHTHHIAHTHSHSQTPHITSHTLAVTHMILYMYE